LTKKRIWELDALRGLCILAMVVIHLIFDLSGVVALPIARHPVFVWVKEQGGVLFLLLSGICVTLGTHSLRRGAIVLGCGMLCSLVTAVMQRLGFLSYFMVIRFGVLHCLGVCMLLWPLCKRLPPWLLTVFGVAILAAGFYFETVTVSATWLYPLGLTAPLFSSGDYFPLAPNLGWFLLGAALGRRVYANKTSRFPNAGQNPILRALCFCGRHSLFIYLLHQPLITGLMMLL